QATKTFAKVKVLIREALAKIGGVVKGAVKIIARLTYRQRYAQSTGRDPLICPHCRGEMGVWPHLAPDLWGDPRRGGSDQTRHVCITRPASRPLRQGWMFQESARRALCALSLWSMASSGQ